MHCIQVDLLSLGREVHSIWWNDGRIDHKVVEEVAEGFFWHVVLMPMVIRPTVSVLRMEVPELEEPVCAKCHMVDGELRITSRELSQASPNTFAWILDVVLVVQESGEYFACDPGITKATLYRDLLGSRCFKLADVV